MGDPRVSEEPAEVDGGGAEALTRTGNPATDYALALLAGFVEAGVADIVVSPGSRSQALALAAAELERAGAVRLHVRIDERVGGFLALGLTRETGAPTVIVTTSGTATANLHPAVLEAHEAGLPMVVVTADRPRELRGIRSNQTTRQDGLYGTVVRASHDVAAPVGADGEPEEARALARAAVEEAVGAATADPGPVHLNVGFREPLSVAVPPVEGVVRGDLPATAGPDALGREVVELVVAYRELLQDEAFGARVERAVVFGHPTLTREVPALLLRDDVEVVVVAPTGGEAYNPGRRARVVGGVRAPGGVDLRSPEVRSWVGSWVFASRRLTEEAERAADPAASAPDVEKARSYAPADALAFARAELAAVRAPITRPLLAEALWRYTWPHDRLVLGASRLIRDADRLVPGKKIVVHSNRGLAGIDGTIATATGIALAAEARARETGAMAGVTRVLLGDLALLHDVGALLGGAGEARPHLQVVVGNDGGGTIFDGLEVAATAPTAAFDRVLYTPQSVDLSALARAYGWQYGIARTKGELDQALSAPPAGASILEVPLPR
jgi:2-succinyl-5-enolpyruvyl-6-hydroxy-3-cyclohexene-1-carboxylate synthase